MTHEELEAIEARFKCRRENTLTWKAFHDVMADNFTALIAEVKRLTCERDAAIGDLKLLSSRADISCRFCAHCLKEEHEKPCCDCVGGVPDFWEWRGVREAYNVQDGN